MVSGALKTGQFALKPEKMSHALRQTRENVPRDWSDTGKNASLSGA